jgi:antitoxin (DNA-binding transcriptional repressor) of toxin-antitoxin stability system
MEVHVTASELREDLTRLSQRVSAGRSVIIEGRSRPRMLFRRYRNGDRGNSVPITRFRRNLHRVLREIEGQSAIITVGGWAYYWVGLAPDPTAGDEFTRD